MKTTKVILPTIMLLSRTSVAFQPQVYRQASRILSARTMASASVAEAVHADPLVETYNNQVTNELKASQLYLSASLWCESRKLVGMAAYMRKESEEERSHALSFIDFAHKRDFPLQLQTLDAPPTDWESVTELWQALLDAEKDNTQALEKLGQVADEKKDAPLSTFLDPFFMEQVESEHELDKILAKARDMETTPGFLRQLDNELGEEASSA